MFVSSTCYDLKQLRADIFHSLDSIGLEPVLSEYSSFPIQPDAATIENCLAVVEAKADIFVLIIGGRYGSASNDGRSITNREFLAAQAKGIPIYIFVQRTILDLLGLWTANPNADFSSSVDTPKLFEFVSELREGGERWVVPFDTAQDIFTALKIQFAYLFRDSLQLRLRAAKSGVFSLRNRHLSGREVRLVIERPKGWEFLLLSASIRREFETLNDIKRDWKYQIAFGPTRLLKPSEFLAWSKEKNEEARRIVGNLGCLFNNAVQVALGPPGVSGDADAILYIANRFASLHRSVLQWKLDFCCITIPPEFDELKSLASCFCDNVASEVEDFQRALETRLETAMESATKGQPIELTLTLKLTMGDLEPFTRELERLSELIETRQIEWS